jgi:hypothetical protein
MLVAKSLSDQLNELNITESANEEDIALDFCDATGLSVSQHSGIFFNLVPHL